MIVPLAVLATWCTRAAGALALEARANLKRSPQGGCRFSEFVRGPPVTDERRSSLCCWPIVRYGGPSSRAVRTAPPDCGKRPGHSRPCSWRRYRQRTRLRETSTATDTRSLRYL